MTSPRSQLLIAIYAATGATDGTFVCPEAHVVLIKQASISGPNDTDTWTLRTLPPSATWATRLADGALSNGQGRWDGWVTVPPGHMVQLQLFAQGMSGWVSGSVLQGPPLFPPSEKPLLEILASR